MQFTRRRFLGLFGLSLGGGLTAKQLAAITDSRQTTSLSPPPTNVAQARFTTSGTSRSSNDSYHHHHTVSPDFPDDSLDHWRSLSRSPVIEACSPLEALLLEAIERVEPLYLRYASYAIRRVTPLELFQTGEPSDAYYAGIGIIHELPASSNTSLPNPPFAPTYLAVWDHDRQAGRTYRLDRFTVFVTAPWMLRHLPAAAAQPEHTHLLKTTARWLAANRVQPIPLPSSAALPVPTSPDIPPFTVSEELQFEGIYW